MKQILQHLGTGELELAEVPTPCVGNGYVLIQTRASLISAGTERMLVEFSKGNLLQKARSQPEKVKQVIDKIKTDGLAPTLEAVFRKLDEPLPLGYCNAGVVLEVGAGIHDLKAGDRVISNGPHAEIVCVPRNLVAKIPHGIPDEQAAFTVLSAVALQGIRLIQPALGEWFVVFGVGLLGLITIQLLRAAGCQALAVDINDERLSLAAEFGAQTVNVGKGGDPIAAALAWTNGIGVDGVLITASAKTDELMHQAAQACRKRGRIVLVGVVGLNLRRSDFYEKELSFQVSCSYGPGRYDEAYEQQGRDYPLAYVRWTEGRNFEAVLGAMATGALQVGPLISHCYPFTEAVVAYDKIQNDPGALGVILQYPKQAIQTRAVQVGTPKQRKIQGTGTHPVVGVIGVGNFAVSTILPALTRTPALLKYVAASRNGAAAFHVGRKFEAEQAVTDYRMILDDPVVDAVFIITGHHTHARMVREALETGKHVFVEKPLCLTEKELSEIKATYYSEKCKNLQLMVGFNRRFSPHVLRIKDLLAGRSEPLCMTVTVNAGAILPSHWTQKPELGGGRIIGEGCHFIDLLSHLAGSPITRVAGMMIGGGPIVREDKMSIMLSFADGSIGTVHYLANGSKSFPKETLEVFSEGRVIRMENFRLTLGYGFNGFKKFKTWRQDKGHRTEIERFIVRVRDGGTSLIPFQELENVTHASIAAVQSAQDGSMVLIPSS